MVTLTQAHKNLIVRLHNTKRNTVASGRTKLRPACRMSTMQWDDELARMAAFNVKQCQMRHDSCRNTQTFKYSGQNLARSSYNGTPNIRNLLQTLINMWYNEIKDTTMAYINRYPNNYSGPLVLYGVSVVLWLIFNWFMYLQHNWSFYGYGWASEHSCGLCG